MRLEFNVQNEDIENGNVGDGSRFKEFLQFLLYWQLVVFYVDIVWLLVLEYMLGWGLGVEEQRSV